MSGFRTIRGFEEVWRPPVGRRARPEAVLGPGMDARSRLRRLVARTPEVMVKVTGRTRDGDHLRAHLDYITRRGALEADTGEGTTVVGRGDLDEVAAGWSAEAGMDSRRRKGAPLSLSIVLSMPPGTNALQLRDAAAAFAAVEFGGRHDYLFVLHTDAGHPHVHLTVNARSVDGRGLNPKKADLEAWRQTFARELRARGVPAEATPRRTRGVIRKAERSVLRKLRERAAGGAAPAARVARSAVSDALDVVLSGVSVPTPWLPPLQSRQRHHRALLLAQARALQSEPRGDDAALGRALEKFVQEMPVVETQRQGWVRHLRRALARRPQPSRER